MQLKSTLFSALGTLALGLVSLNLQAQVSPKVNKTTKDHSSQVIGYITQWDAWKGENNDVPKASYNHLNVDYSQYTILNYSFFGVAVDGSLHGADYRNKQIYQDGVNQAASPLYMESKFDSYEIYFIKGVDPDVPSLFKLAHDKGVKVMASIGGWSMCKHFKDVAADATKRKKFTDDCKKLIDLGFDGIDIDWEYPGRDGMNFKGTAVDFANHLQLMKDIRAAIGSGKLLTGCFAPVVKDNEFDWKALEGVMDYFNMMTYDYNGGWSNIAGHNSPLYDYPGAEYAGLSLDNTTKSLKTKGVNLSKVNLGAGFYGRGVVTEKAGELNVKTVKKQVTVQPDGPITTAADYTNFALDVWDGTPNYSWIVNKCGDWTEKWDETALVPYKIKGNAFLSYDNVRSIGCKADYIKSNRLAGVIVWQIYGDMMNLKTGTSQKDGKLTFSPNTTHPLVNELNEVFAGKDVKSTCRTNSAVHEVEKNKVSFEAYPNPTNGQIHIYIDNSDGKNEVKVYNAVGQLVFNETTAAELSHVDLSNHTKGIYFISVTNSYGIATAKIVKQ
jgi:chitinase